MIKFDLILHLNLPKLLLLGVANLCFIPIVGINPVNGQSNSSNSFSCASYQTSYATIARSSLGIRPIIIWDVREPLCDIVSQRFQAARDNGNLRFLMIDRERRVCGTDRREGECRSLLFIVDTPLNAQGLLAQLINNSIIEGRVIAASGDGTDYYDLEQLLDAIPVLPTLDGIPLPPNN